MSTGAVTIPINNQVFINEFGLGAGAIFDIDIKRISVGEVIYFHQSMLDEVSFVSNDISKRLEYHSGEHFAGIALPFT